MKYPEELPSDMFEYLDRYDTAEMVKDYVAGMTDRYSTRLFNRLIPG